MSEFWFCFIPPLLTMIARSAVQYYFVHRNNKANFLVGKPYLAVFAGNDNLQIIQYKLSFAILFSSPAQWGIFFNHDTGSSWTVVLFESKYKRLYWESPFLNWKPQVSMRNSAASSMKGLGSMRVPPIFRVLKSYFWQKLL